MNNKRIKYLAYNSLASLLQQVIALICGLIVPRLIINTFGSATNGTVTAIAQFISITSLIQGGVSSTTRVAFYRPVSSKNEIEVSKVYNTSQAYFRKFAIGLFIYIIILATSYGLLFKSAFSYSDTVIMVLVIGISSVFEYIFGITNQLLLFADQRGYINTLLLAAGTLLSSLVSIMLMNLGCTLIIVKLSSGIILTIRPIVLHVIIKRRYNIDHSLPCDYTVIEQRHSALAKSIAFYVHTSTDTLVITALLSPIWTSIYAVHRYVVNSISSIVSSILGNTEVVFGHMLAQDDNKEVDRKIPVYDLLSKILAGIFFTTAMTLISPFVELYTINVKDTSYHHPVFAFLLCCAEMIYCMSLTYHNIIMAAGHIKQTKWISITEAMINICVSIALVFLVGIEGVALGTLLAFVFNTIANIIYMKNNIFNMRTLLIVRIYLSNIIPGFLIYIIINYIICIKVSTWFQLVILGIIVLLCISLLTILVNVIFIRDYSCVLLSMLKNKYKNRLKK